MQLGRRGRFTATTASSDSDRDILTAIYNELLDATAATACTLVTDIVPSLFAVKIVDNRLHSGRLNCHFLLAGSSKCTLPPRRCEGLLAVYPGPAAPGESISVYALLASPLLRRLYEQR